MTTPLLSVSIRHEHDVVAARQRARLVAAVLGFDVTGQTRIATAVSEIARNAFVYAGGGRVDYRIEGSAPPQLLVVSVVDQGPGIRDLAAVLGGRYRSPSGLGLGIAGARRLMDRCVIESSEAGTTVTITKILGSDVLVGPREVARLADELSARRVSSAIEEVQQQNQELLRTLQDLRARQEELERVNQELEDTNRGVVALYAELDERADHLRRADELKTRFLSNMTHEFRTPVNSILALVELLADRVHAAPERKDEVYYIRKAAHQLSEIVNDLLDIAKAEAGKIEIRPAVFDVSALFGALRGMLRPLLVNAGLTLVFDEPEDLPPLFSDESKLSQILRNLVSNALKYTEAGEVRVSARPTTDREAVEFKVADTGIGIPPGDLERIFDEFVQIENPLQRRAKGTGLGLPLSRRLAELLGGAIAVDSTLGLGSTFTVRIPLVYRRAASVSLPALEPGRAPVLVVEDSDEDHLLYVRALEGTRFQPVPVHSVDALPAALEAVRPAAIVLDIRLHGRDAWDVLARLKRDPATASVPLIVASTLDDRQKGYALGADVYAVKPVDRQWLLATLDALTGERPALRVLVIDDEEASRFIVREILNDAEYHVLEAANGSDALQVARQAPPDLILLDLCLPDAHGLMVRERLRDDASTAEIPVIVLTGQRLSPDDHTRIGEGTPVVLKASLTRESLRTAIRQATAGGRSKVAHG